MAETSSCDRLAARYQRHQHDYRRRFIAAQDRLAGRFAGRILSVGDAVVRRWGVISGTTKRLTGHSPPVIDTLFAATALEHDLYFATRMSGMCGQAEPRSSTRGMTILTNSR